MENAALLLRRAREILAEPGSWIRDQIAVDGEGLHAAPEEPQARAFCAFGALCSARFRLNLTTESLDRAESLLKRAIGGATVALWNDAPERTHAEVLTALTEAERLAEAEGAS